MLRKNFLNSISIWCIEAWLGTVHEFSYENSIILTVLKKRDVKLFDLESLLTTHSHSTPKSHISFITFNQSHYTLLSHTTHFHSMSYNDTSFIALHRSHYSHHSHTTHSHSMPHTHTPFITLHRSHYTLYSPQSNLASTKARGRHSIITPLPN